MTGDEMSVLFHDPHDLIDALEGRTVKACDDGCEAHGVLRRVTQRGEERDVGPGWSSPTIYMVDIVTPETGDLICRTDVRNFDLLEVVPVSDPTPSTDGAPEPGEVRIEPTFHKRTPDRWTVEVIGLAGIRMFSVEARGPDDEVAIAWANEMADLVFRPVVPEDRPALTLDFVRRQTGYDAEFFEVQINVGGIKFQAGDLTARECDQVRAAAGVPALDDDTRREVPEVLLTFAKWADWYLEDGCRRDHHGYCQAHGLDKDCPVGPMREWLAAYLGGTDGR